VQYLELLGKAEVDNVTDVHFGAHAYEEVVGLDVPMDVRAGVHKLQSRDHLCTASVNTPCNFTDTYLICEHQH
jgi:hypothetical protein